jgi:NAD(P)-dependent dehydrogenase (short-subunit alcohol dehydrogenase family)
MELKNQTLILTGASRGIGKALALDLAKAGVNLVLNARSQEALDAVAGECRSLGVEAKAIVGDAAQDQTVQFMVKAAKVIGNFAGFIHNAAVLHSGPFVSELEEPLFDELVSINIKASYLLARYAYPNLLRSGGGIAVFLGSGAAERHFPGSGVYGAVKAAEEYLAKQLALEHPQITSFVYRPGMVDTDMQAVHRSAKGSGGSFLRERFGGYYQRGELISAEEAAQTLLALLGDSQRFQGRVVSRKDLL